MSINNHSTIQSINVRLTRYLNSLQKILSSTRQLLNFSNLISESNLASSDKILKIKQENTFRIFIFQKFFVDNFSYLVYTIIYEFRIFAN